jgi:hypothetical protein
LFVEQSILRTGLEHALPEVPQRAIVEQIVPGDQHPAPTPLIVAHPTGIAGSVQATHFAVEQSK